MANHMPDPHEVQAEHGDPAAVDPQQARVSEVAASLTQLALADPALYGATLGTLILASVLGAPPSQSR